MEELGVGVEELGFEPFTTSAKDLGLDPVIELKLWMLPSSSVSSYSTLLRISGDSSSLDF